MATYAEKIANLHAAMVNDSRFGYSQWPYRWGEDGKEISLAGVIIKTGSYDCSSSVIQVCNALGIPTGRANYTGDMERTMTGTGAFVSLPYSYGSLIRGDIILRPSSHVTIYQGNGKMSTFDINENGGIYSGRTGDQTGYEARIRDVYNFGQTRILRCVWNLPHEQIKLDETPGAIHRLYNRANGEHFFTANKDEAKNLIDLGWGYEEKAWVAPSEGIKVYRLYNPNAGDHHYTVDENECNILTKAGWQYEGIAFLGGTGNNVYRVYNPHAITGTHLLTTNEKERDALIKLGWKYEGIAFKTA